jgi:hypothetical protein
LSFASAALLILFSIYGISTAVISIGSGGSA